MLRLTGHGEHDDASYIPEKLRFSHAGRDCLLVAEKLAIEKGWVEPSGIERWRTECRLEVDQALATASKEPTPDPFRENWRALSTAELAEGQFEA